MPRVANWLAPLKPTFKGESVSFKIRVLIKSRFRYFALLPVVHCRALGIRNSAGNEAIEMAYVETLWDISKSQRILDAAKRTAHGRDIAQMTFFFGNPPG